MRLGAPICILFIACAPPGVLPDAGTDAAVGFDAGIDAGRDPGFDIPPDAWFDAGQGDVGGCYGRSHDHFVLFMETRDNTDLWCAAVLFQRQDGGFIPLFPDFGSPDDFEIVDARYAQSCSQLLQTDGTMKPGLRPVHDLWGSVVLRGYFEGWPQAADVDGGIRLSQRLVWFNQSGGLVELCPGP